MNIMKKTYRFYEKNLFIDRETQGLSFLYLLTHGWTLCILNAIYWDDWILSESKAEIVIDMFIQQSATLFYLEGYAHVLLMKFGPWIYRLTTMVLMFYAGIFLNEILRRSFKLDCSTRLLIVILFLIAPFNIARVSLVDFRYTLCYFMFFWAWYLLPSRRLWALCLFFLSFNTQSLLVFYALPFIEMMQMKKPWRTINGFVKFINENIIFLALPFGYFILKNIFFSPTGIYHGYNKQFDIENLLTVPLEQFANLYELQFTLVDFVAICLLSIIPACLLDSHLFRKDELILEGRLRKLINLLFFGFAAYTFGVFPYWVLGHVPTFNEWSSRHQLLMPLGGAILFVGFVTAFPRRAVVVWVCYLTIGLSIWINFKNYAHLYVDSRKTTALVELIARNDEIKKSKLIIFVDKTLELNALDRTYRNYEWNGLLKKAFGDELRYSIDYSNWRQSQDIDAYTLDSQYYIAGDFERNMRHAPLFVIVERSNFQSAVGFWASVIASPSDALRLKISNALN